MYVLGISCYFHDSAAALVRDGVVVAAAEEERFTRIKHDFSFPHHALRFCLESEGIRAQDIDYVGFFEKPLVKFDRILQTTLATWPRGWRVFRESMINWFLDKLWVKELVERTLSVPAERILFCDHHQSHAASCFYPAPFSRAAILTVDGVGEWATATLGAGVDNQIRVIRQIHFPHSLGLLYSAFTAFLGFEVNEGEYKVMGMAPYGEPRHVEDVMKLIRFHDDGSFSLDMDYFSFHYSAQKTFNSRFERLFGRPRPSGMPFFTRTSGYPPYFGQKPPNYDDLCRLNEHYADIAASIQRVTEEAMLRISRALHSETQETALCLAGGVALNSVANGRIRRETPFRQLFVQPSAGDGGGALGAALYVYHGLLGKPRNFVMGHAYLGAHYEEAVVRGFLDEEKIPFEYCEDEDRLVNRTVEALVQGQVVGWFQGRFEFGPRALGNRSILADPRRPEMKDIVNTKIKFREPYRPFAPSVLAEATQEFFEGDGLASQYPARFMLLVESVRPEKQIAIPAVTHVDGTGRLQVVHLDSNPLYHRLIRRFGEATGVPVVLNTSFNMKGEPIVNTPAEAFRTFRKSDMDLLVLGRYLVWKNSLA